MPHRAVGSVWIAREGVRFTQIRPGHRVRVEENIGIASNRVFNLTTNRLVTNASYTLNDVQFFREEGQAVAEAPPAAVPVFQPDPEERYFLFYRTSLTTQEWRQYTQGAYTQEEAERVILGGVFGTYEAYMVPARAVKRWANRTWDEEYGRIAPPRG